MNNFLFYFIKKFLNENKNFWSKFVLHDNLKLLSMIVVLINIFLGCNVYAAALEISPIRLDLSNQQPITSFTLTNKASSTATNLQITVKKWTQKNGQDIYSQTEDLLVTPPILVIPPGASRIVRLGLRRSADLTHELSYRIFINEIPSYNDKKNSGISMLLQLSVPVFIAPLSTATSQLCWHAQKLATHQLKITLNNCSTQHIKISQLKVSSKSSLKPEINQETFVYLLPLQTKSWIFPWPSFTKTINITTITDWGKLFENVTLSSS